MTIEDVKLAMRGHDYVWVRIFRGGRVPNCGSGRLYGIQGSKGVVIPNRHGQAVLIPLDCLTLWHSRNENEVVRQPKRAA